MQINIIIIVIDEYHETQSIIQLITLITDNTLCHKNSIEHFTTRKKSFEFYILSKIMKNN